jgi:uncharacterized protein (TIGR03435 family)
MQRTVPGLVAGLSALLAMAQTPVAPGVEFEVVSVKLGDPASPGSYVRSTQGGVVMRSTTLRDLVRGAYQLNEYQLEGGPKWIDSARFNIDAKLPVGAPRDQIPRMMQALLADRFQLQFHYVTKSLPEWALVVAKGGPKLEMASENDSNNGGASQGPRQIKGFGLPLSSLARMLISLVEAPVIDRTGLEGKYNFSLEFAPMLAIPKEGETTATVFEAIQEKLGLKLEATKGPVQVLVIDRAETPSEN